MKKLLLISIPLFVLHGIEEGFTGILTRDPFFVRSGSLAIYVLLFELFLIASVLLVTAYGWGGKRVQKALAVVSCFLLLFEFDHPIRAVMTKAYYPGFFTGAFLGLMGVVYCYLLWKRWCQTVFVKG